MRIHLPNSAFLGNIDNFLRGFDPSEPERLLVTANQKWLSLHPLVLSMVAAQGLTVGPNRIDFETPQAASAHYLVRMHLFDLLQIPCRIHVTERAPEGRFIPLTQVRNQDETSRFVTDMIPLLHLDADQSRIIAHIVSELLSNVLEHSRSDIGAVLCAQYYRKSNRIGIGIADTGCGLRATINRSWIANTDLDAIKLALWPGVTGTTKRPGGTAENAGAGLFIVKSIAHASRDLFTIYSGTGFYKLLRKPSTVGLRLRADPFTDRHSKGSDFPKWAGTVVGIDITLSQTRAFKDLLNALAGSFYKLRRVRPGKRAKPIFI